MNDFKDRLLDEWLSPFCERHGYAMGGFVTESVEKLDPNDAADFLSAIDIGLVVHDRGVFRAPCSKASEQIFWQGDKKSSPRRISLWLEPIITMAGLFRLHAKYGWPKSQLGMQSKTWAFDLVAYTSDQSQEVIDCEVKKSWREIEKLVSLMNLHRGSPAESIARVRGAERNALKKVLGLRQSRAPVFWALGPGNRGEVFEIRYGSNEEVLLVPANESSLVCSHA